MPAVLYEKRGHAAWITLNRPAARNTLDAEAFVLLRDAWREVRGPWSCCFSQRNLCSRAAPCEYYDECA